MKHYIWTAIFAAMLLLLPLSGSAEPVSLYVSEDAYIAERSPSSAMGASDPENLLTAMNAGAAPSLSRRDTLLKFDLSSADAAAVTEAVLHINVQATTNNGVRTASVYKAEGSDWSEDTVTWNSAPAADGAALGEMSIPLGSYGEYTVDVTDAVRGNSDSSLTLRIILDTATATFTSKEASASSAAWLELSYDPKVFVESMSVCNENGEDVQVIGFEDGDVVSSRASLSGLAQGQTAMLISALYEDDRLLYCTSSLSESENGTAELNTELTVRSEGSIGSCVIKNFIWDGDSLAPLASAVSSYGMERASYDDWTLVWSDEFDGDSIDEEKWTLIDGGGGFGNEEKQYYRPENARVEDGMLKITAEKESYKSHSYTSAKLTTQYKADFTYGKFEARMKLPVGSGFWPAFWMMPTDSEYGTWASSGELDIMEARGRLPQVVGGAIHYGGTWPNNRSSNKDYTFPDSTSIADFHTYGVEWEPGEIRWYVDGQLYFTQNSWSTSGPYGEEQYTYPAPFDKDFYLILNLAVGGTYDGGLVPSTAMFPAEMQVDYVRVYELTGRPYREPAEPEIAPEDYPDGARQPDSTGNFVNDVSYSLGIKDNAEGIDEDFGDGWNYVHNASFGGAAQVTTESIGGEEFAKINVTTAGSANYAVQLMQHVPTARGRWYKLSFDAMADSDGRMLYSKIRGNGTDYSEIFDFALTTEPKSYSYVFQMTDTSNILSRIEFNCSQSTGAIWIGNVRFEETSKPELDENATKIPLEITGNHVYNGSFDKYTSDRLAYWEITGNASVPNETRELTAYGGAEAVQKAIVLTGGEEYRLSFDAHGSGGAVEAVISDGEAVLAQTEVNLSGERQTFTLDFSCSADTENAVLTFRMTGDEVCLDSVQLIQTSMDFSSIEPFPLKNGSFDLELLGWTPFTQGASAAFSVQDGAAKIEVKSLGSQAWNVMLQQTGLQLRRGADYRLSFDAWADNERDMEFSIENSSYYRYFEGAGLELTSQPKHFSYTFKMTADDTVDLKFLLGLTNKSVTGTVYIDNVVLEVVQEELLRPSVLATAESYPRFGSDCVLLRTLEDGWQQAISSVRLNGEELSPELYSFTDNTLIIASSAFERSGSYTLEISADGYADTSLVIPIYPADGNLILNGDMEADSSWDIWHEAEDWSSYTIADGQADIQINYHGKTANEWNVPYSWSTQFYNSGIKLEKGKSYEISFRAWSDVERPIQIELTNYSSDKTTYHISSDSSLRYSQSVTPNKDVSINLNFLLGYIEDGGTSTPDGVHHVYIDDVSVKEAEASPTLTADTDGNDVGGDITLTFADSPLWRENVTAVRVNGKVISSELYTFEAGSLTIDGSLFPEAGDYSVSIEAEGYISASVAQRIKAGVPIVEDETQHRPVAYTASDESETANPAVNALDNDLSTRWAGNGDTQELILDLGESKDIGSVSIAFWKPTERTATYSLYISDDGSNWTEVYNGKSSSATYNTHEIGKSARYVRLLGRGTTANSKWLSVLEIAVYK